MLAKSWRQCRDACGGNAAATHSQPHCLQACDRAAARQAAANPTLLPMHYARNKRDCRGACNTQHAEASDRTQCVADTCYSDLPLVLAQDVPPAETKQPRSLATEHQRERKCAFDAISQEPVDNDDDVIMLGRNCFDVANLVQYLTQWGPRNPATNLPLTHEELAKVCHLYTQRYPSRACDIQALASTVPPHIPSGMLLGDDGKVYLPLGLGYRVEIDPNTFEPVADPELVVADVPDDYKYDDDDDENDGGAGFGLAEDEDELASVSQSDINAFLLNRRRQDGHDAEDGLDGFY